MFFTMVNIIPKDIKATKNLNDMSLLHYIICIHYQCNICHLPVPHSCLSDLTFSLYVRSSPPLLTKAWRWCWEHQEFTVDPYIKCWCCKMYWLQKQIWHLKISHPSVGCNTPWLCLDGIVCLRASQVDLCINGAASVHFQLPTLKFIALVVCCVEERNVGKT